MFIFYVTLFYFIFIFYFSLFSFLFIYLSLYFFEHVVLMYLMLSFPFTNILSFLNIVIFLVIFLYSKVSELLKDEFVLF